MIAFKRLLIIVVLAVVSSVLASCASENELTKEEVEIQNSADWEVANLLFSKGLTKTASYNVHKDGFVVIKFDKSVKEDVYNEIVKTLRTNTAISGVRGEQEGMEVCPLPF